MTEQETFKRLDGFGKKIDAKLYPYRWYLLAGSAILGFLSAIYF